MPWTIEFEDDDGKRSIAAADIDPLNRDAERTSLAGYNTLCFKTRDAARGFIRGLLDDRERRMFRPRVIKIVRTQIILSVSARARKRRMPIKERLHQQER